MQKQIDIAGLEQPVILARRKGVKHLRISIKNDGVVRVSVPYGVPEFIAKQFVLKKTDWINQHVKPSAQMYDKLHVGKHHRLIVDSTSSRRSHTKISSNEIIVKLPDTMDVNSNEAQTIIKKACDKALLIEAEKLLPQRLKTLSDKHNIPYKNYHVKKLKSRWGACDNHNNITLNTYLIQLDWALIDYVICHELSHTIHLHHQPSFWKQVKELYPDYKYAKKQLKTKPTDIFATQF